MPEIIEDIGDIVEELADKFGIYGCGPGDDDHPDDCKCRICFVAWMRGRIEKAVEHELKEKIIKEERERIANYLKVKYGDVGKGASRTAVYLIAKDLSLDLILRG